MIAHRAFPADGFAARWGTDDGVHVESLTLRWENEGWTAVGAVGREDIQYVVRLTARWAVSQFLLFRDLDEADLWLGTDGHGRWGEVNGAHRTDLDGATDIALAVTPFTHTVPIRRLPLAIGDGAELSVLDVDVDTLGAVSRPVVYERLAERRWRHEMSGESVEFDVDEYGLPLDIPGRFRRLEAGDSDGDGDGDGGSAHHDR
ncbi:MAG: putative glycolipid-binding domain-containing protein [Ilumatobacteraceae bacterium]